MNDSSPVPAGCLPAVVWFSSPPHSLLVDGPDLFWLTGDLTDPSALWYIAAADLGRVPPRRMTSFPVRTVEHVWPDGVIEREEQPVQPVVLLADGERLLVDHPDGIAEVPRQGGAAVVRRDTLRPKAVTGIARQVLRLVRSQGAI